MKPIEKIIITGIIISLAAGCESTNRTEDQKQQKIIKAKIEETSFTKTTISLADITSTSAPVKWTPEDKLGVFSATENNIEYQNVALTTNTYLGTFAPVTEVSEEPLYAYYPYSSENNGKSASNLSGTIPNTQLMNLTSNCITGDYKYGTHTGTFSDGSQFSFRSIFALGLIKVDASSTDLEGESLKAITLTVTRNNQNVPICGDFTFSAIDGSYSPAVNSSNILSLDWISRPKLSETVSSFCAMFPEIQAGDILTFEILTSGHKAKLTLNAIIDFQPGHFYTFPLTLSNYGADKMTIETRTDITASGTFTCATYNVDGLPAKVSFITINEDGPGSEGTKEISQKIASSNWDFVGFSEDFEYNTELQSALTTDYAFGTHAGSYSTSSTDGLNFAVRKSNGVTFSNETRVAFKDSYGGLTSGANTSITKGFRYYLVKLADGTEVDVIITHMNTYSSSGTGHINAQHAQLTQIAEYIKGLMTDSTPRPVILMGDTNCRYTRHDFQTHFWSKLNGYTVLDPWVEYWWDGIYPEYSTSAKSLVVEDATGTNSSTDIIYSSQQGEVVDKVIYINDPKASVQISANSYLRDPDYKGLADHWPIVVEFTYEKYK